jgi:hypothetical protein
MINRLLKAFCLLIITGTSVLSQEQFVQFTYYDQLTWSEDGNQLAFRCILLDESNPDLLKTNILLKDLNEDQLICLNPQPERFVISQDREYLLFSSSYGLYLVSLEEKSRAIQIYFRNPAANWFFQNFGFVKDQSKIFIDRYDYVTMNTIHENYQIQSPKFSFPFINWVEMKKIDIKSQAPRFDLPVDEMIANRQPRIRIKDMLIEFLPQPDSEDPGNFKLIYQPSRKDPFHAMLIDRCRPRLLSVNPDSTEIIVSVFMQGAHKTYRLPFSSKKLIPIENKRYFSVSWLGVNRYICITEEGMFFRSIDLSKNEKIDRWQFPEWCRGINLDLPKYELQVGFEPEKNQAEQWIIQLQKSGFQARMKYFKDQFKAGYRIRVGAFQTRQQAQSMGKELKQKGYDYWIDTISDYYDYFNSIRFEERKSFENKTAIVQYKFGKYLRSRIVLKILNEKEKIVVDEMNNIPGRMLW